EVRFFRVGTDPRAMLAELEDLDLVVLGLRTHGYLKALVTGSTTEWMLHDPPAPLVGASSPETVRRVTVCADGSGHAARAIDAFTSLPFAAATTVTVLTIDDGRTDPHQGIESAVSHLEDKVAEIETVTAEGAPTPTILAHLEEQMPDL